MGYGCYGGSWGRRYLTKQERVDWLKEYQKELENELQAVKERMKELETEE